MFLFFILGILFVSYVVPIGDEILSLLLTRMEVSKGKMQIQLTEIKHKINEIVDKDEEKYHPNQIGFTIDTESEEYEDEE